MDPKKTACQLKITNPKISASGRYLLKEYAAFIVCLRPPPFLCYFLEVCCAGTCAGSLYEFSHIQNVSVPLCRTVLSVHCPVPPPPPPPRSVYCHFLIFLHISLYCSTFGGTARQFLVLFSVNLKKGYRIVCIRDNSVKISLPESGFCKSDIGFKVRRWLFCPPGF